MSDRNFETTATGGGLVAFLDYAILKGYLKTTTGQSMKTAVKEVLSSTEGADSWSNIDLDQIDMDDILHRFETLRAMKFATGSLNAYKGRFQRAVMMFEEFRASPAAWRPSIQQRTRNSKRIEGVATRSEAGPTDSNEPTVEAEGNSPMGPVPRRATIITYPFPIRDGVLASIELPADLTRREAQRLAAFIDSLTIEDQPDGPSRPATAGDGK